MTLTMMSMMTVMMMMSMMTVMMMNIGKSSWRKESEWNQVVELRGNPLLKGHPNSSKKNLFLSPKPIRNSRSIRYACFPERK